jgi:hypothetical protein
MIFNDTMSLKTGSKEIALHEGQFLIGISEKIF